MNSKHLLTVAGGTLKQRKQANYRGGFACAWSPRNEREARSQGFGASDALPIGFFCQRAKQCIQLILGVLWHVKWRGQTQLNGGLNRLLGLPRAP